MSPLVRVQWIVALQLAIVTNASIAAGSTVSSRPAGKDERFTLRTGASVADALKVLHQSTNNLIVAETAQLQHRWTGPEAKLDRIRTIAEITRSYHLHALDAGHRVLFIRRLWDPRELPAMPLPELTAIATDLHALIEPLSPHHVGLASAVGHRDFVRSLTAEQVAAALKGQLGFQHLTPDQRQQWGVLTADFAFNNQEYELRRGRAMYRNWQQADIRPLMVPDMGGERHSLWLRFPFRSADSAHHEFQLFRENPEIQDIAVPPAQESTEVSAPAPKLPDILPAAYSGQGRVTLDDLVKTIAAANRVTVQIPEYARSRTFYVFADGQTGGEVLRSVADVAGWELRALGRKRYVLDRPRIRRSKDYWDYYRQVAALVPPFARLLMGDDEPNFQAKGARMVQERRLFQAHLARTRGSGWAACRIRDLPDEWQERLANMVFENSILHHVRTALVDPRPPGWLVAPDRGFFVLTGELGPGKQPLLKFMVERERKNDRISFDMWGWIVNSSTLPD